MGIRCTAAISSACSSWCRICWPQRGKGQEPVPAPHGKATARPQGPLISDITSILGIINKLVDKGSTVIVVEHNLDVMRNADWIIDLSADGGIRGGEILFEGKPADLPQCEASITAAYITGKSVAS